MTGTARKPLLASPQSTRKIMQQVLLALAPALGAAVWRYGAHAALLIGASLLGALLAEASFVRRDPARGELGDGSALVTGAIFSLLLPANAPVWVALAGGVIAIALGKHVFGGLGKNPFNPAALARVLLMGLVPAYFFAPAWAYDGVTQASPLAKEGWAGGAAPVLDTLGALLKGDAPGCLGQAAPMAIVAGGLLLIALRTMDWRLPLVYLGAITMLALLLPPGARVAGHGAWLAGNPLPHLLAGGTLVAAFFLLTDPVTAPFTPGGRVAYALVAAGATMGVRFYTPYPDGAALAVLVANAVVPAIDRLVLRKQLAR